MAEADDTAVRKDDDDRQAEVIHNQSRAVVFFLIKRNVACANRAGRMRSWSATAT